jgi:hypothetical protein
VARTAAHDLVSPRRVAIALGLLVLVALGPFVAEFSAQTAARYSLSGAIVDDGTIRLDAYEEILLPSDRSDRDGHTYSDKPPLQPLLGVPAYATAQLVGAEPSTHERIFGNLGAWWVTLWTSTVPAAGLCGLMYLAARRRAPDTAAPAALALSFGTLLLVFSTQMYGHVLSATLGFAAWWLLDRADPLPRRDAASPPRTAWLVGAGALAGAAVVVEYTLVFVAVACLLLVLRHGAGAVLRFVGGAVPFVLLLAAYNTAAHGAPWSSGYADKEAFERRPSIIGVPDLRAAVEVLLGSRGLFLLTPVVLVAVVGAVLVLRAREDARDEALRRWATVSLGLLGAFLVVQAGWPNPWGGEMPGPRYLVPALPFLVVPLAWVWRRIRLVATASAVFGGLVMGLGVLTVHLVPIGRQVVPHYLDNLDSYGVTPTIFTMAIGPAGWSVHGALVVVAVLHLRRTLRAAEPTAVPATASSAD